jgi:hypothetical protein
MAALFSIARSKSKIGAWGKAPAGQQWARIEPLAPVAGELENCYQWITRRVTAFSFSHLLTLAVSERG